MNYAMLDVIVGEKSGYKYFFSKDYEVSFIKHTGFMQRWGSNSNGDADFSPFGPEIADIEIVVDGCMGAGNGPCSFCYKSNTNRPARYMTLETFKRIMEVMPRINGVLFLQQIAFGITGVQSNPDFLDIMRYTRELGVVPNFTLSGFDLDDEFLEKMTGLVGAVAVSCYQSDKQMCYNTIRRLSNTGLKQVNMHLLYHDGNEQFIHEVINDIKYDTRLENLNACVLLGAKPKGRGKKLVSANDAAFERIANHALIKGVPIGFDSCSASKFSRFMGGTNLLTEETKSNIGQMVEPCESFGLFSTYINVDGVLSPCSFAEGEPGWEDGFDLLRCEDFLKEIWFSERMNAWRQKSLDANRNCIIFPEIS